MVALAIAIAPVVPGFMRAAMTPGGQVASPTIWDTLYTYAWFVTFTLSLVTYLALMNISRAEGRGVEGLGLLAPISSSKWWLCRR